MASFPGVSSFVLFLFVYLPLCLLDPIFLGVDVGVGGKNNSDEDSDKDDYKGSKGNSKEEDQDALHLEKHHVVTTPSKEKPPPYLLIGANTPSVNTPKGKTTTPIPILPSSNTSSTQVNEAWQCIQHDCGTCICPINNTMWLYLWPLYVNEDNELVTSQWWIAIEMCGMNTWGWKSRPIFLLM